MNDELGKIRCLTPYLTQVRPAVSELNAFLDKILWWVLVNTDSELQRDAALELLASILNKRVETDGATLHWLFFVSTLMRLSGLDTFLISTLSIFWDREIATTQTVVERRKNAINIWIWVRFF